MRPAVLAAVLWFEPDFVRRMSWGNKPLVGAARVAGRLVMGWLDRRRDRSNELR
ncbi:MAG: hypothetical protein ABMA64_37410 [Myxococcota bacterium]